jgi:nucleoside-diphosphate-sugar epimerase
MNFLVTGATGFIGQELLKELLKKFGPENINCLVKASTKPSEVAALSRYRTAGIKIIYGDLDSTNVSDEAAPSVDIIFHLAANIDTAATEKDLRVNDIGTERLLYWLGKKSRAARIIYTSSIAALDRNGPASQPLNESSPQTPRTMYGRTKLRGEQILQTRAVTDGYTYTILRLGTVYGPGGKTGGLFDLLFRLTAERKLTGRINWPGRTSVIHVADVVAIMIGLAQRREAKNEIFCVANSDAPTVGELAQRIGQISGFPVSPVNLPVWIWPLARAATSSALLARWVPPRMRVSIWRVSLIVDNGFWFDTRKLQSIWSAPLIPLDQGLSQLVKVYGHGDEPHATLQEKQR